MPFSRYTWLAVVSCALLLATRAEAILFLGTDPDPAANRVAPGAGSPHDGWDYEGEFGVFLGTAIAPNFFVTAKHISGATGTTFRFQGTNYTTTQYFPDPTSDLAIYKIDGTLPVFAPLYARTDEVSQRIVDIGRGTERGNPVYYDNDITQFRGWTRGADTHVQRWGENIVAGAFTYEPEWDLLAADFDSNGLPSECHLTGGDSCGAAFIDDGGVWKLAGINYAVDGAFYIANPATAFDAALIDVRGYHFNGGAFVPLGAPDPVPSAFYPTRISTKLLWIYSVIAPAGDYDGNGMPDLLQYALKINTAPPGAWSAPHAAVGSNYVSTTYQRIVGAPQLTYEVEQSTDLSNWSVVTPQETLLQTAGNVQFIEAKVLMNSNTHLFLRVKITQQ